MLFKTSLLHIRKNATIVSVLGFFLSLSVTVLTSVDHLSDNLNKGFKEIDFDSNSHDLILVNKSFKQTQNLNVKPSYSIDLSNIKFGPKRGFRWSFDSNFDYSWVKKGNKDKLEKLQSSSDSAPALQQLQQRQHPAMVRRLRS
ncbi:hypothetical protein MHF_0119 [Mycoplasma haemofelis Ohio2]|uniref:Uncharacterized protein n=1 Tax=Mycoplasma haemofelis (strain Ohio2) TaxID=859194 RepID=F6FFM8_MYCHI|nr:hypothetical protein MHF_0119 [Mycoplasma haemofelis Ohio2]